MLRCSELIMSNPTENRCDSAIQLAMCLEGRLQGLMLGSIRVPVCENELQLFGIVASWHEKQQAQELAREVAPTYRIRNELQVSR